MASLANQLFRVKSADAIVAEGGEHADAAGDVETPHLKRTMGLFALTMFSVGSIVGTGIFVILGTAVPLAGPAILLSFVLAAFTCMFSALSYAELAGTIPVSGSSYSYAYATLGELIAWVVGWCLMLEYGVSVAAVAVGWGQYLNEFFADTTGWSIPEQWSQPPEAGGTVNVTAVIVVLMCAFLLMRGASESAKVNSIMVVLKIGILLFFCIIAFTQFDPNNLTPFLPLGFAGVSAAAGQVFFSYIGFDAASTAGEEAKNPRRDLPLAILGSLLIVTIIYVLVTLAAIGALPWVDFEGQGGEAVLATIARDVTSSSWAPALISLGAVVSIFSVVLVVMYGQTRILFAMGRDGLLPKIFTRVNPRTQTPTANTIIVTAVIVVLAGFVPLGQLAEATSIGTLVAFAIVNVGVVMLWLTRPDLKRSFRTPLFPALPIIGVAFNLFLVASLRGITWLVFAGWMTIGLIVYFAYSRRHSLTPTRRQPALDPEVAAPPLAGRSAVGAAVTAVLVSTGLLVVSFHYVFNGGLATVGVVLWALTLFGSIAGVVLGSLGLARDRAGRREIGASASAGDGAGTTVPVVAGDLVVGVRHVRASVLLVAAGLFVPTVLAVFAITFGLE